MSRPETGAMKFGDDWCGVFIRGDNAFHYANLLDDLLNGNDGYSPFTVAQLRGLVSDLRSCFGNPADAQKLKSFGECK